MKHRVSLKWFFVLSLVSLAAVLVIGYSLLSARYFILGMDHVIAANMAKVVKSFASTVPEDQRERLNQFSGYEISREWEQMPQEIREEHPESREAGMLMIYDDAEWFSRPELIIFCMHVVHRGESYYISHRVPRGTPPPPVGQGPPQRLQLLLAISLYALLVAGAITLLLLRQVQRPVRALGIWARKLSPQKLQEPLPDFSYPELNDLALLIRNSLSSVQKSLEREQRFLRHSSHELRTPISIIRNNIELLNKASENPGKDWEEKRHQFIQRIDRASLTMKNLTETLLWLSRDAEVNLPVADMEVDKLVQELAEEARYLLKGKGVEVEIATTPHMVSAAIIPARIVIGNLIRNAFQHTWRGKVCITQSANQVEIINDMLENAGTDTDLGFGLGLQLTEQLCAKLGWPLESHAEPGKHLARVYLKEPWQDQARHK